MLKFKTKHFLTGEELSRTELLDLIEYSDALREERNKRLRAGDSSPPLQGKHLALCFEKPSLRTRMSFTIAMSELGGDVIETSSLTAKKEEPEDFVRVIGGFCHGVMVRTFEHSVLERMCSKSPVPVINGLSDSHHPCQILADLLTLKQYFKSYDRLKVAYIGDGNNILHSLLLLLPYAGVDLRYACPEGFEPNAFILKKARARAKEGGGSIHAFRDPASAVKGVNAIYTDVWTSMGFEEEARKREEAFEGYQLTDELYSHAAPGAIIMHCMPMNRGKEITDNMVEHSYSAIFRQSENRLHVQKALLVGLLAS